MGIGPNGSDRRTRQRLRHGLPRPRHFTILGPAGNHTRAPYSGPSSWLVCVAGDTFLPGHPDHEAALASRGCPRRRSRSAIRARTSSRADSGGRPPNTVSRLLRSRSRLTCRWTASVTYADTEAIAPVWARLVSSSAVSAGSVTVTFFVDDAMPRPYSGYRLITGHYAITARTGTKRCERIAAAAAPTWTPTRRSVPRGAEVDHVNPGRRGSGRPRSRSATAALVSRTVGDLVQYRVQRRARWRRAARISSSATLSASRA